ncbi:unnamed protein product [Camellia sinensis]
MSPGFDAMSGTPPGISLLRSVRGKDWSLNTYRYMVLLITFIAYTCYHASRKPSSIVKSVLDPDPKKINVIHPWPIGEFFVKRDFVVGTEMNRLRDQGWAPFNGTDGTLKLGEIDVAFLACYSLGMYVAGHLGDTLDLRLFLTTGMIGSGIFVGLFGMGYFWNIHVFWFYLVMQMVAGLFQATGWPSVVAVIGNWFGKRKRGLIMGIWNAHTSVGNISGSLLAASVLEYGWGWSFILPGAFIILGGTIVYLFLAAYPEDVGFPSPHGFACNLKTVTNDEEAQIRKGDLVEAEKRNILQCRSVNRKSIGLFEAFLIPGVIPFALCLFFSKLVAYTFLYWLPFYLSQTGKASFCDMAKVKGGSVVSRRSAQQSLEGSSGISKSKVGKSKKNLFKAKKDTNPPIVPPAEYWCRAPFFGAMDLFWARVDLFDDNGGGPTDFLLGGVETEKGVEAFVPPESIVRFHVERGTYPYSFPAFEDYTGPKDDFDVCSAAIFRHPSYCEWGVG